MAGLTILAYLATLTVEAVWLWRTPYTCTLTPVVKLVQCVALTYGAWLLVPGAGLMLLVFVSTISVSSEKKELIRRNNLAAGMAWYAAVTGYLFVANILW